jgi:hypothetical protein
MSNASLDKVWKATEKDRAKMRRTEVLLARFRGHKSEWAILHGALCATHADHGNGMTPEDCAMVRNVWDTMKIAARLDELNREARAAILAR